MSLSIAELSQRSLKIFRELVDAYVKQSEPRVTDFIKAATKVLVSCKSIRNVMSDLEEVVYYTLLIPSAGRLPTDESLPFCSWLCLR